LRYWERVDEDLVGIVRVKLNESHQSIGAIGLLFGEEAVEPSDDATAMDSIEPERSRTK
jgi:hypothetical protein